MIAHSAAWCQCSSRMPPLVRRMLTPEIVFETGKSACVTWRAQPPFWMRFGASLNDAQPFGIEPTSVGGGDCAEGNWSPRRGFCGPGSARLPGPLPLMAPCGGRSGLPNDAALADVAASAPTADTAKTSRREYMAVTPV